MRNIGSCLGYKLLALNSLSRGLDKLELNKKRLDEDLNNSWEVLTEAIQTILRKNHIPNGYELMKDLSRGKEINQSDLINFVDKLNIPTEEKERLLKLTPQTYIGYAEKLSKV
jgi:adenylosuccinate lyase